MKSKVPRDAPLFPCGCATLFKLTLHPSYSLTSFSLGICSNNQIIFIFPCKWYKRFGKFIVSHGYNISPYDSHVYHSKVEDGWYVYLLLYVDDMLIATWDKYEIQKLKSLLCSEFEMKDMGAIKKILGMEIRRDSSLSGSHILRRILGFNTIGEQD